MFNILPLIGTVSRESVSSKSNQLKHGHGEPTLLGETVSLTVKIILAWTYCTYFNGYPLARRGGGFCVIELKMTQNVKH